MFRAIVLVSTLSLAGGLIALGEAGAADGPPEVVPLALSPAEQSAVMVDPDGTLRVVGAGEELPGGAGRLVEVLPDRLVVDLFEGPPPAAGEKGAGESSPPVRAWVYPPERPGMPPLIQRLLSHSPDGLPTESLIVPETVPEELPAGARVARPPAPSSRSDDDPSSASETGGAGDGSPSEQDPPTSGSSATASRRDAAGSGR